MLGNVKLTLLRSQSGAVRSIEYLECGQESDTCECRVVSCLLRIPYCRKRRFEGPQVDGFGFWQELRYFLSGCKGNHCCS